jgi:hypothetical protein
MKNQHVTLLYSSLPFWLVCILFLLTETGTVAKYIFKLCRAKHKGSTLTGNECPRNHQHPGSIGVAFG